MSDRRDQPIYWIVRLTALLVCAVFLLTVGCGHKKKESENQESKTEQAVMNYYNQNNVFLQTLKKLKNDPNNPKLLYHLADLYDRGGQYPKAVEAYEKAIKNDPDLNYAYFKIGTAYGRMKQPEKAVKYLKEAAERLPQNPVARNNLGIAYGQLGRLDDEIAAFKDAIAIRPRYASARFNLGVTYLKKNDLKKAREQYEALKKFDGTLAQELMKRIEKN